MKTRNLLLRILFILNLCAAVGMGLSLLSFFVSPETFWMLAFLGLGFTILSLCNLIFVIFWLFVYPRRAIVSGILLLIALPEFGNIYRFNSEMSIEAFDDLSMEDSTFRVLSYNVRLFDLYNWTENKTTRNNIMQLIDRESADILCFQEFFYEDTGKFNTLDTLKRIQGAKNVHIEHTAHVNGINHWGIATFTRFPIINKGQLQFKDSTDNISIFTDIQAYGDTIRIYNLHLESIRFRSEDYKTLKTLTGNEDKTNLGGPQKILGRMRRAYIRRARQAEIIAEHINECPYPIIVAGDFNDPPTSYAYHTISSGLADAFRQSGSGLGTTYVGLIPLLRIDYIFYSEEHFDSRAFRVINENYSDHYPITTILKIKSKLELEQ